MIRSFSNQMENHDKVFNFLRKGNILPNPTQELLLKACILSGKKSIDAYYKWKSQVNIDYLDTESYRLLPMLYRNMEKHSITDPIISRCKGVYKKNWYKNRMALSKASKLLDLLHTNGIKTMVLKGLAMGLEYYPSFGMRPMNDFDIMVPFDRAPDAIEILESHGWRHVDLLNRNKIEFFLFPRIPIDARYLSIQYGLGVRNASGQEIDIHWYLSPEYSSLKANSEFWNASQTIMLPDGIRSHTLCATDLLLHTIIHGLQWAKTPVLRWISDAHLIISTSEINWKRLMDMASNYNNGLYLKIGLLYLNYMDKIAIPNEINIELSGFDIDKILNNQLYIPNSPNHTVWTLFLSRFKQIETQTSFSRRLFVLLKKYQYELRLKYLWQLPLYFLFRRILKVSSGELHRQSAIR